MNTTMLRMHFSFAERVNALCGLLINKGVLHRYLSIDMWFLITSVV